MSDLLQASQQLHQAAKILVGACDGAARRDETGFNKFDAAFGRELAYKSAESWTVEMAHKAFSTLRKYRRQLAGTIDFDAIKLPAAGLKRVEVTNGEFAIIFPYDTAMLDKVRALPRRHFYDRILPKRWLVPAAADTARAVYDFAQANGFTLTSEALDLMESVDNEVEESAPVEQPVAPVGISNIFDIAAKQPAAPVEQKVPAPKPAQPSIFTAKNDREVRKPTSSAVTGEVKLTKSKVVVTFTAIPDVMTRAWMKEIKDWEYADTKWSFPKKEALKIAEYFPNHKGSAEIIAEAKAEEERLAEIERKLQEEIRVTGEKLVSLYNPDEALRNGRTLYSHQKEDVKTLVVKLRQIVGNEMGTGKTITALVAAKLWQKAFNYPIIVIAPVNLRANWFKEAAMVGVRIEFYSWSKIPQSPSRNFVLIGDECFPYHTKVQTDQGLKSIGEIVANRLDCKVLSYNLESSKLEYKPIKRYVRKQSASLLKVKHECGEFNCTPNHKIYVQGKGYIRADEIKEGDSLRVLRERVHSPASSQEKVLFNLLFCEGARSCAHGTTEETSSWEQAQRREKEARRFSENEAKQSYEQSSDCREDAKEIAGQDFSSEGWEWRIDTGTETPFLFSENKATRRGVENGVTDCDKGCYWDSSLSATCLQSGYRIESVQASDRSRWPHPQNEEMEVLGQSKGYSLISARVESVTSEERRCFCTFGQCTCLDCEVYNLEIEDNHNYFANDVLVSNCHYAKNMQAKRTKDFLALAESEFCKGCYPMTGTPIENGRPAELFPLLKAIRADLAKDKKFYEKRYCAGGMVDGRWDSTGASHMLELHEKIKPHMIRRLKKDCLDLPPKVRTTIKAELSKAAKDVFEQEFKTRQDDYYRRLREAAEQKAIYEAQLLNKEIEQDEFEELCKELMSEEGEQLVMVTHMRAAGSVAKVDHATQLALEVLRNGNPVLIFTDFVPSAKLIAEKLKDYRVEVLTGEVTGNDKETGTTKRQAMVDRFQAGQSDVFISTFAAGGVGITLTRASDVILVDRPWKPGAAIQAEDRLHRIGQASTVNSIWLQCGKMDQKVDQALITKSENIDQVLEGKAPASLFAGSFDRKFVRDLFEDMATGLWEDGEEFEAMEDLGLI